MKGGANRGAYEAGAIYALVHNLPEEEVQYDVISGVSVGALNAAHVASYPKGKEKEMSIDLIALWSNFTTGSFYQNWKWGGIIRGFLKEKGIYDSSPLHNFIGEYFRSRKIHRLLHINSVDANTGDIQAFDETNDIETLIKGLCASTAVPFLFPPVEYNGKILMDGGVAWNLDVASAILKCREIVDSDSKITLDIIDVDRCLSSDLLPLTNN